MIKEIFDIEPVQKNSLLMFVGIFFLSFLQVYLFKNKLIDNSLFIVIGICLALTVCWSVLNFASLFFFFNAIEKIDKSKQQTGIISERVIFSLGLLAIGWITLLMYISYELDICFKNFIRLSILVSVVRTFFWFIISLTRDEKNT